VKDYTILGLLGKYQDANRDMSDILCFTHTTKKRFSYASQEAVD